MNLEDFKKFITMYKIIIEAVEEVTDITYELKHYMGDKTILLKLANIENNVKNIKNIINKTLGVDKDV